MPSDLPGQLSNTSTNVVNIEVYRGKDGIIQKNAAELLSPLYASERAPYDTADGSEIKSPEGLKRVDDKDAKRLDEKIEAFAREGQLRLDTVMAKIEGQTNLIVEQVKAARQEMTEQREDGRASRAELAAHRSEMKTDTARGVADQKSQFLWIIATVIGTSLTGVVIIIAAVTFAHADFGLGLSAGDVAHKAAAEVLDNLKPPVANTPPKPPT